MLIKMNNEAKVRYAIKSIILEKAKVIGFEDIEVARATRATKEVIKGKGKRGRNRKSAVLELEEPEIARAEVARAVKEAINNDGKLAAQEADEPKLEVALMISAPAP